MLSLNGGLFGFNNILNNSRLNMFKAVYSDNKHGF